MKEENKKEVFTLSKPILLVNKDAIKSFRYASKISTEDLEYLWELYDSKKHLIDFLKKGIVYISDLTLEDVNLMDSEDFAEIGRVVESFLLKMNMILTRKE